MLNWSQITAVTTLIGAVRATRRPPGKLPASPNLKSHQTSPDLVCCSLIGPARPALCSDWPSLWSDRCACAVYILRAVNGDRSRRQSSYAGVIQVLPAMRWQPKTHPPSRFLHTSLPAWVSCSLALSVGD